jgi:hypothetical protein
LEQLNGESGEEQVEEPPMRDKLNNFLRLLRRKKSGKTIGF